MCWRSLPITRTSLARICSLIRWSLAAMTVHLLSKIHRNRPAHSPGGCERNHNTVNLFRQQSIDLFFRVDRISRQGDKLGQRLGFEVFARAQTDGDRACLGFLVADDEHVRNLLQLGVANLGLHAFA